MEKLCSLKHITPGTIVEVPERYSRVKGELAVLLTPQYLDKKSSKIVSSLLRQQGNEYVSFVPEAVDDSFQLQVAEDANFKRLAMEAFATSKFELPELRMSTGCDPEIFMLHGDGSIFPAWEFMPDETTAQKIAKDWLSSRFKQGSAEYDAYKWVDPENVMWCPQRCMAYWDGAQAEFAPYAKNCLETLHYGTRMGLQTVLDFARLKDKNAKLTLRNVVELPAETLKNADDKYIQFRCSQSLNIYNDPGEGIPDARKYKWRCAGGHIHIGYLRRFTASAIEQIVRALDGILGVAGVCLAAGIDNPERRNTYGRAGEFRLPAHGLEYRVLSNFWLSHPAIAMLVFELARAAVRMGESGLFNLCWDATETEIREVINTCDVQGAKNILQRNVGVLTGMLANVWTQLPEDNAIRMRKAALHTILNGIGAAVATPGDIEKNWKLGEKFEYYCRDSNWMETSKGITC